jgi:hypothetical protein
LAVAFSEYGNSSSLVQDIPELLKKYEQDLLISFLKLTDLEPEEFIAIWSKNMSKSF